ncbi:endonuclease/exonuclease/phosphatase family protein [Candidatus Woesearchaeota archaeon]|nr:endonuclease/exonuclease/phosphatase family protein [Candidatus Woesearchaeota archaeon]
MKVALYNQMFGMDGTNIFSSLLGHWAVHFQSNPAQVHRRVNLAETIKTIAQANADIVGICEILEGQEQALQKALAKIGYRYCFFGNGHQTQFSNLTMKVALASKFKCQQQEVIDFPLSNEMGGGGGILRGTFPDLKLDAWLVHLALPQKRRLYGQQIKFLQEHIAKEGKLIVMGDFNLPFARIKDWFSHLELASDQIKTCSTTPLFRTFKFEDLDHIFIKGLRRTKAEAFCGKSDHKLIWAEVKKSMY